VGCGRATKKNFFVRGKEKGGGGGGGKLKIKRPRTTWKSKGVTPAKRSVTSVVLLDTPSD